MNTTALLYLVYILLLRNTIKYLRKYVGIVNAIDRKKILVMTTSGSGLW